MRIFLMLTMVFLLSLVGHNKASSQNQAVFLKPLKPEYKSLNEVKPVLVNNSNNSIYLLPEDCGGANLWLLTRDDWLQGGSIDCSENTTSIEIKPGGSYRVACLAWRHGRAQDRTLIEAQDLPGKYKIVIRYSLNPVNFGPPRWKQTLIVAEEFSIAR